MNAYFVVFKRKDGYSKKEIWAQPFRPIIREPVWEALPFSELEQQSLKAPIASSVRTFRFAQWLTDDTAIYEEV